MTRPPTHHAGAVNPATERVLVKLLDSADRADRRRGYLRPGWFAQSWALTKLALLGMATPFTGPLIGAVAARNRRALSTEVTDFAALLDAVTATAAGASASHRAGADATTAAELAVGTIPARGRYFISSDLHRGPPGTNDLVAQQGTAPLYQAALDHYASAGWTLVENGDAEEFWLTGGSAYGVVYDAVRTISAALKGWGEALRTRIHAEHLRRIIANNADIYRAIRDRFLARGRYVRLVGNHDDFFGRIGGIDALRQWLPNVDVWDMVVLIDDGVRIGVITHGHHPDSWNAPEMDGLGKFCGSWASALYDAPGIHQAPGIATAEESQQLLAGTADDHLVSVNRVFGASLTLYTTDEVLLFESFRRHWPSDDGRSEAPLLLLGHTHVPRINARPTDGTQWPGYFNSGSGVGHRLVTGIEWDGTEDPRSPDVKLVAWIDEGDGPTRRELGPRRTIESSQ